MTKYPGGGGASAAVVRTSAAARSSAAEHPHTCDTDGADTVAEGDASRRVVDDALRGGGQTSEEGSPEMEEVEYEYYDDDEYHDDGEEDADYYYYYDDLDDEGHSSDSNGIARQEEDVDRGGTNIFRPRRPLRVFRSGASRTVPTPSSSPLSVVAALPKAISSLFVAHLPRGRDLFRTNDGSFLLPSALVGVVLLAAVLVRSASVFLGPSGGRTRFGKEKKKRGKTKRKRVLWKTSSSSSSSTSSSTSTSWRKKLLGVRGEKDNVDEPFPQSNTNESNNHNNESNVEEEDGSILDLDAEEVASSSFDKKTKPKRKLKGLSPSAFDTAWKWVRLQTDRVPVTSRSRRGGRRRLPPPSGREIDTHPTLTEKGMVQTDSTTIPPEDNHKEEKDDDDVDDDVLPDAMEDDETSHPLQRQLQHLSESHSSLREEYEASLRMLHDARMELRRLRSRERVEESAPQPQQPPQHPPPLEQLERMLTQKLERRYQRQMEETVDNLRAQLTQTLRSELQSELEREMQSELERHRQSLQTRYDAEWETKMQHRIEKEKETWEREVRQSHEEHIQKEVEEKANRAIEEAVNRAVEKERERARLEMMRVREGIKKVLERERKLMREQVKQATVQVREWVAKQQQQQQQQQPLLSSGGQRGGLGDAGHGNGVRQGRAGGQPRKQGGGVTKARRNSARSSRDVEGVERYGSSFYGDRLSSKKPVSKSDYRSEELPPRNVGDGTVGRRYETRDGYVDNNAVGSVEEREIEKELRRKSQRPTPRPMSRPSYGE